MVMGNQPSRQHEVNVKLEMSFHTKMTHRPKGEDSKLGKGKDSQDSHLSQQCHLICPLADNASLMD